MRRPDILLALNQEAYDKYALSLAPGGTLITDETFVKGTPKVDGQVYRAAITAIAREKLGREIVANIVALGVLVALTGVVSREAIEKAVLSRVPRGTEDLNRRALQEGFAAGEKMLRRVGA